MQHREEHRVVIRRIQPSEGPGLRAIRLRAIGESPSAFGSTLAETEARPTDYWDWRAASGAAGDQSVLFVAEDESGWVGLVGGFLEEGERARSAALISMWVDPAYRGQGLGRQLVERLVEWARGHGVPAVELWVTENNEAARSLYTRCGFRRTGETQALPSNPALLEQGMVLELESASQGD